MTVMDWNDLASRNLPTLGGGRSTPRSSASAPTAAAAGGWTGDSNILGGFWSDRAGSLTAAPSTAGWNTNQHTSNNHQHQHQHSTSTTASLDHDMSLQARLMRHEQSILETIIHNTAEQTRQRTDDFMEAQLQKAWEQDRERWRKEWLGPRSGGTSSSDNDGAARSALSPLAVAGSSPAALSPVRSTAAAFSALVAHTPGAHSWHHHRQPSTAPLDVAQVTAHLSILQRMERPNAAIVTDFMKLASVGGGVLSPVQSGYYSAWQWMQHVLHAANSIRTMPGHQRTFSGGVAVLSPAQQAAAALSHLCLQFQNVILDRTRLDGPHQQQAATAPPYQNDFANQCAIFAKLTLGLTTTTTASSSLQYWPCLYYCLRSGDAVAALHVYEQSVTQPHATVHAVLHALAQAQGSTSYSAVWQQQTASLPHLSVSDRRILQDLLEAGRHREPPCGLHEQGVYALLSGLELPVDSSVAGFSLVEDYLTGELWKALLDSNPEEQLQKLGKSLCDLGSDYFADAHSGGWCFAWPLLLTQQYERALSYLTEAGGPTGLLQATHLAYILVMVGIPLTDLGATPLSSSSSSDSSTRFITSLLVSYTQQLLGHASLGPTVAVEYLVRIPDPRQASHQVAKLIATTGELEKLVGGVDSDGVRIKGGKTIDSHFSPMEIAHILADAAESLVLSGTHQKNPKSIGLAAMCYMLAERYADVLQLLNQLLSPPEQPDDQRQFWLDQLESFRSFYLTSRTHVVQVLEQQGKMSVVETSRTLVELNAFFDHLRNGRHEQAWATVDDRLQLLPTSRTDLAAKEKAYYDLDPLVQKSFPALLLGAMQMLHREHRRLKLERHGQMQLTDQVAKERLKQIQERGKLLVTSAGLVGIVSDQLNELSRLDSLLI